MRGLFLEALLIIALCSALYSTSIDAASTQRPGASHMLDPDKLSLASVSAAVVDANTGQPLFVKNGERQMSIASITKLMTAMVVLDSGASLDELLTIEAIANKSGKNAFSRIRLGSRLSRGELLRLTLMSSENRAAGTLARSHPGGERAFVHRMNNKASELGMYQTVFIDPTGLSPGNVSTSYDLVKLLTAAMAYPLIQSYSTTTGYTPRFKNPSYSLRYGNTNVLVHRAQWDIMLSKTGYLREAGRCLVLALTVDDRPLHVVLLDSFGKRSPIGDVGRIRKWLERGYGGKVAPAARAYEQRRLKQRIGP